jgi:hypothetical protein
LLQLLHRELEDQSVCADPVKVKGPNKDTTEPCVGPMQNKTYLQVYNCDFIRPPKPERFARAMKQIYRPSFVLSHFIHYSTVTSDMAQSYSDFKRANPDKEWLMDVHSKQWEKKAPDMFMDETTQGALIHARSVLPHETRRRSAEWYVQLACYVTSTLGDSPFYSSVCLTSSLPRSNTHTHAAFWSQSSPVW